jgi:predicted exporter/SAM-dependent methyltransferase
MKADFYARGYLWLAARRGWVLATVAVLTVAAGVITMRLDLEEDILGMLPQRDPVVDEFQYALKKFRQIDRVYLDVGIAGDDPVTLGRAADELYAGLATNPALARILYRFETQDDRKLMNFVTGALPDLFTEADARALEEKLAPAKIREYLMVMRRKLAGPEGLVLKDVVAADPVGMSGLMAAKLLPLQGGFGGARIEDGRIVSEDGRHVLLMAEPRFPSSNSREGRRLVADLLRITAAVEQHHPGVHVAMTGGHRMAVDNATLIERDAMRCTVLGMTAMLVLCFTAYRRRWLAVVTFLPSVFGMLMAGAVLALWLPHLSSIAVGFASIAVGITVDYAIYVVYHLDNAAGLDRRGVGEHVGRLVLPITAGALTTIAAFVVMASSPMRGYQQMGILGAVGVLFSAAFALAVLPLLVPIPRKAGQPPLWMTRLLEKFFAWRTRRMPWLLALVVVLTVAGALGLRRLRFEGDIARLNGITDATRRDEEAIRRTWGDALGMTLVVARGATLEEALAQNDRVADRLSMEPGVTAVYSVAAVCPSQATQAANRQRWRVFWTESRRAALRETLTGVGKELGFRADAFHRFWEGVETEPVWVTPDTFLGTPLEQSLRERVLVAPGDVAVSTMVKLADRSQANRLRAGLGGAIVLDKQAFSTHVAALAKDGLGRFALWTTVLVAAILYFLLGAIELVVVTLLPLAFGLLWTLGAMGWMGLPIDTMNCIFVIFIIGVGEDYSVFLVTSKLDEWRGRPHRLAATGASVFISLLTTICGFAVLAFARHPVLFSLGTTVLLGMTCAFAAILILTLFLTELLLLANRLVSSPSCGTRQKVARLYRYQGKWVEQFVYWKMRMDPMFAALDGVTPRRGLILDLGCGYGIESHWLAFGGGERTLLGVDYDADKIRVAQRSSLTQGRVRFEHQDILTWDYPACDTILLLDVLHYWQPAKQQALLAKAHAALRPGGRLVLRDAARAATPQHRRVERWEHWMTRLGHNKTLEGIHFRSAEELVSALKQAGFRNIEVNQAGGRDSNLLITGSV